MNVAPRVQRIDTLLQGLLDRGFQQKVAPVVNALTSDARVRTALSAFQKEAERLAAAGEPFTRDNPALLNLRSTLARAIDDQAPHIDQAGKALANDAAQAGQYGARQLSLFGLDTQTQVVVSSAWNRPDPAAIARVVDTTSGKPWMRALDTFGDGVAERVNRIAIAGIVDGQNPMDIARNWQRRLTASRARRPRRCCARCNSTVIAVRRRKATPPTSTFLSRWVSASRRWTIGRVRYAWTCTARKYRSMRTSRAITTAAALSCPSCAAFHVTSRRAKTGSMPRTPNASKRYSAKRPTTPGATARCNYRIS